MKTKDQVINELSGVTNIPEEECGRVLDELISITKTDTDSIKQVLGIDVPAEQEINSVADVTEPDEPEEIKPLIIEKPVLTLTPVEPVALEIAETKPEEPAAEEAPKPLLITKPVEPEAKQEEEVKETAEPEEPAEIKPLMITKPVLTLTPIEPEPAEEAAAEPIAEEPEVEQEVPEITFTTGTEEETATEEEAPPVESEPEEETIETEAVQDNGLIVFDCECCGDSIEAPSSLAETEAECPFCGTVVMIPAESQAAEPEEPIAIAPEPEPEPVPAEPITLQPITLTPTPIEEPAPIAVTQPEIAIEAPAAPPAAPAVATAPKNEPIFDQSELDKTIRIEIPDDMLNPQEEAGKKTVFIKRRRS